MARRLPLFLTVFVTFAGISIQSCSIGSGEKQKASEHDSLMPDNVESSLSESALEEDFDEIEQDCNMTVDWDNNSFFFNICDGEASVASKNESDTMVIPCKVIKDGKEYPVTSVSVAGFEDCINLKFISISENVSSIGDRAFYGCTGLTSVSLPNVAELGQCAFCWCTELAAIDMPNVEVIGRAAFKATGLSSITIPNGVKIIGPYAFYDCANLSVADVPESVEEIGERAFSRNPNLLSVNVDKNNERYSSIDGVLYSKNQDTLLLCPQKKEVVELPSSVKVIGISAFESCGKLTSITIPNSVTSIGSEAFCNCPNLDITIDNREEDVKIGSGAFLNCKSVKFLR